MPVATIIQCYSSFLVMGALIGFFKKRSLTPLFAAVALTIVGFTAAGMENTYPKRANQLCGVLSLSMFLYMGYYYIRTFKFMHAGLVSLVSACIFYLNFKRAF
ncbi:unnamed protein product [Oikopleura dioica]|uniref:Uncharacterized protein n=1 Tax=Oikopleura dioica TaxID=34765 RepID=E4WWY9_OIKDI|nr:unnamed protein product [Oikopleura dioica]